MELDPNDPLIPLPWQGESIKAYRAQRAMEAAKKQIEFEKAALDLEKARGETLSGKVSEADMLARMQERSKQQGEYVPIEKDIASQMTQTGGPSILKATEMQKDLNVENAAKRARLGAIERTMLEKKLIPEAKIDMGGVSATVPFQAAGERASSAYDAQYKALVPQIAGSYMAEGFDRDSAYRKASEDVRNHMTKAANSGKVVLSLANGSTISYSNEEAMKMWKDPKTPATIKEQLIQIYGQPEGTSGSDWVKSRLVR